jgi:hypothetical protein
VGVEAVFTVQMQSSIGLPLSAVLRSNSGDAVQARVTDLAFGKYEVRFTVPKGTEVHDEGATWRLAIELHGCGIQGSPFPVEVKASVGVQLTFQSPFDKNGVLYYLGTKGGTREYQNPHTAGEVVAKMSSIANNNGPEHGAPERFVQHAVHWGRGMRYGAGRNLTDDLPNSWMSVDLGEGRTLVPNDYCLRHWEQHSSHALRTWRFEGSIDGAKWTVLRKHSNDQTIRAESLAVGAWKIESWRDHPHGFRHFRIVQSGPNSESSNHLICSGIEIYGLLRGV